MYSHRVFISRILVPVIVGLAICLGSVNIHVSLAAPEHETSSPDIFGYIWDSSRPYNWVDATDGEDAGFDGDDDNFIGPIALGFDYAFYEYSYSALYVSTNGVVSFGDGTRVYENTSVPRAGLPNNFIAPFWDDLAVGGVYNSGKVYTKSGEQSGSKYFVIQWNQVTRKGSPTDPLTFELILYENGDACVQYHTMSGALDNATVGIEDGDGIEGSLYRFNTDGIANLVGSQALCFDRPAPAPRVKVLPTFDSRFAQNYQAQFEVQVRNTGDTGADTFDLTFTRTGQSWPVEFYQSDGNDPLVDTDGDGVIDSGALLPGETKTIIVRINASESSLDGEYSRVSVQAKSSLDGFQTGLAVLQSAIPSPFAQIYTDSQTGMHMQFHRDDGSLAMDVSGDFTGSTLTLAGGPQGDFIYAWERRNNNSQGVLYSDIEFVIYDRDGAPVKLLTKLTNHQAVTQFTLDHSPALAVLPNGQIGVAWVRDIYNQTLELNSNIYLAILDQKGALVHGPDMVTQNSAWRGDGNFDVPQYINPQIIKAGFDNLVLAWIDDRLQSSGDTSDVVYAVYSGSGAQVMAEQVFAESVPGGVRFLDPNLSARSNGDAVLTYAALNPATSQYEIMLGVFGGIGNILHAGKALAGAGGRNVDSAQLSNGDVLVAWIENEEYVLNYTVLDGNTYEILAGPYGIQSPFGRQAENPSIAPDRSGNAVLTWMDAEYNDYLYYTLINASGSTVTPAMVFTKGDAQDPQIITSWAGAGNASYLDRDLYLPLLTR